MFNRNTDTNLARRLTKLEQELKSIKTSQGYFAQQVQSFPTSPITVDAIHWTGWEGAQDAYTLRAKFRFVGEYPKKVAVVDIVPGITTTILDPKYVAWGAFITPSSSPNILEIEIWSYGSALAVPFDESGGYSGPIPHTFHIRLDANMPGTFELLESGVVNGYIYFGG